MAVLKNINLLSSCIDTPGIVAAVTHYGVEFVSSIHHENIYAFQFHPEKSQTLGLSLLKRFSSLN